MIPSNAISDARQSFHRLRCLRVTGGFLDKTVFDFSQGLNCLIGARGTGKTTALELVRYAVDALPSQDADAAERKRVESLLQQNLAGGRVEVEIETKEGLPYVVTRSWGEEPMVLASDRSPTELTLKSGDVFRADIYSQNEVERIADRATSQLDLIDNFDATRIAEIESELQQLRTALHANAGQIIPLQERLAAITDELGTLPAIEAKRQAFATSGGDTSGEINQAHHLKSLRDREQRAAAGLSQILSDMRQDLASLSGRVGHQIAGLIDGEIVRGPNGALLDGIIKRVLQCGHDLDQMLERGQLCVAEAEKQVTEDARQLSLVHKEQELDFRTLIEKHVQAQGQAAERSRLENLRNELLAKRRLYGELKKQLAAAQKERKALLEKLSELHDKRFAVRRSVADRINRSLSPAIRVSVIQYGNPELYQRLLEARLRGARIKHGLVAAKLLNAFWPAELSAGIGRKDADALVDRAELNPDQAEKVVAALQAPETLFELETVELLDLPRIELKDGETYKDCLALSTGQKCTAILPILLLDSDNPLLVDQPEDNLDNRFVFETVVDSIRKTKSRRQLIFVTHNPNIPVLGDAEKVFVLDSNGSIARKANEGTVDECKHEIVTLLEGGEEAFRRRKERYAY